MVRYLFYTIGDLTYQSPLVHILYVVKINGTGIGKFPFLFNLEPCNGDALRS